MSNRHVTYFKDRSPFVTDRMADAVKGASKREITEEGFLRVRDSIIARTGIQEYYAGELEITDQTPEKFRRDPLAKVKVYRPPEEVFDETSMRSFENTPITNNHPSELVDASNVRDLQVGFSIGNVRRDGNMLVADLLIQAKDAIDDVQAGKSELSNGYEADIVFESGITPDGEYYDAVQRRIRGNHIAIVERGRAGNARISDQKPSKEKPKMRISVGDVELDLDDTHAQVIQAHITRQNTALSDAQGKVSTLQTQLDDANKERDKVQGELDAEKAKQLTDAQIDERVKARSKLIGDSIKVLGDDFDTDGKSNRDIQSAAICKMNDSFDAETLKSKSDDYIQATYDALLLSAKASSESASTLADGLNGDNKDGGNKNVLSDAQKRFKERNAKAWQQNQGGES